jgi:hydroxypyruvate reductase
MLIQTDIQAFMVDLFKTAVDAADPASLLPKALTKAGVDPTKKYTVIGAGKASAAMAAVLETVIPPENLNGIVVTRYGYGAECKGIKIIEAAHPVPDDLSMQAANEIIDLLDACDETTEVIALISGGGSALLSKPASCLSFAEKQSINKALLRSGASIHEMNTVRKHLSAVKGGRLLDVAKPATVKTFIISDVTGDVPDVVASGPTLPDSSTQAEAIDVLARYNIDVSDAVLDWLNDSENETPKGIGHADIIATGDLSLKAAEDRARAAGFDVINLGDEIEGDAAETATEHMNILKSHPKGQNPVILISGGETTVKVQGDCRGGRNAHYILSAMLEAAGDAHIYGIACDTDGIDGSEDNAGAFFTPVTVNVSKEKGLSAQDALENTDSYGFFKQIDHLVMTGPTRTNVNDFRALIWIPQ